MKELLRALLDPGRILYCIGIAVVPALVFYAASLTAMAANGFTVLESLRDPAQIKNQSSFLGFLSNVGVGLWVSAAAIALFGGLTHAGPQQGRQRLLLLLLGVFSLTLAIDDFFLIHDRYIDQRLVYAFYAVCALALLTLMLRTIVAIDGFAFVLAGSLLAASIATDLSQPYLQGAYMQLQVLEEAFKFSGAATWLYFIWRVAAFRAAA